MSKKIENSNNKISIKKTFIKNYSAPNILSNLYEKEDFLQEIRTIREFCKTKINEFSSFIKERNTKIDSKLETMESNQKKLIELYVDLKRKNEIISDFPSFKNNINNETFNHKLQLEEIRKDMNDLTYKYDRIYIDNFNFPGLIGDKKSRFKNFKDFVFFQVESTDDLKLAKENQASNNKQLVKKFDENINFFVKQIQKIEKITKQYTDGQIKNLQVIIKEIPNEFIKKCDELRLENHKYAMNLLNRCDSLNDLKDKLQHLSNVMERKIEEYDNLFNKIKEERNLKFELFLQKYGTIEQMVYSLNDFYLKNKNIDVEFNKQIKILSDEIIYIKSILNNNEINVQNSNPNLNNNINNINKKNNINIKNNDNDNNKNQINSINNTFTKLDFLSFKQNFEKKYSKIDEKFEGIQKENRKERLNMEEKMNKKIIEINDQVKQALFLKDKTINSAFEKINTIEKTLYEHRKLLKGFNVKINEIDNLMNDKKKIFEEIEKLKNENNYINSTLKKFDNSFLQFSNDYKELESIINGIIERENQRNKMNINNYPSIRNSLSQNEKNSFFNNYAVQTTREYYNRNNVQKQNYFNLNSAPDDRNKKKIKKNKINNIKGYFKKNVLNNNNSSPKLHESHSVCKFRDETYSSRQKRLKLYSLKEMIQKLPDYAVKDYYEEDEKNIKNFEQIGKKE